MRYQAPTGSLDPNAAYVGKNPALGIQGSKVPPRAVEQPQRELVAMIEGSGLAPSDSDLGQVLRAVRSQRANFVAAANVAGTANAITLAFSPTFTALADLIGTPLVFLAEATNTGAMTIAVDGLGAQPLTWSDGTAIVAGDVLSGSIVVARYDGVAFRLMTPLSPTQARLRGPYVGFEGSAVSQSIPSGVPTRILNYSGIVNNLPGATYAAGTLTLGATGKYLVSVNLNSLLPDVGGNYGASIAISRVDAGNVAIASIAALPIECLISSPANTRAGATTALTRLSAGDRIAAFVAHNRGSALNFFVSLDIEFRGS